MSEKSKKWILFSVIFKHEQGSEAELLEDGKRILSSIPTVTSF